MTSFIQPLDAGIIRCFKAYNCQKFCLNAIEKDKAGECNIYKINLLEGMLLACKAWREVEGSTIKNCWDHTKIQGFVTVFIVNEALCTIAHSNSIEKF